jgi:hypothetical protein
MRIKKGFKSNFINVIEKETHFYSFFNRNARTFLIFVHHVKDTITSDFSLFVSFVVLVTHQIKPIN